MRPSIAVHRHLCATHLYGFVAPSIHTVMGQERRQTRQSARLSAMSVSGQKPAPAPNSAPKRRRTASPKKAKSAGVVAVDGMALPPLVRCTLVKRYKRFLADIELPDGSLVTAHCPNPGSMRGMGLDTRPDALVSAAPPGSNRKLPYTLEALQVDQKTWVGCNTQKPNAVVRAWLEAKGKDAVDLFGAYDIVRPEVPYGSGSRVDFVLEYGKGSDGGDRELPFFLEVKNVTMAWDDESEREAGGPATRVAVFPDSKTVRGQKHLQELSNVVEKGLGRACTLYFVNRADVTSFAPCTVDQKYVECYAEAKEAGVSSFPLLFELQFDDLSSTGCFKFSRQLAVHPRAGP